MDINKTIERKRSEIAKLEAEIEALETAHKIMVAEFAQEIIIPSLIIDGVADGGSITIWNDDLSKHNADVSDSLRKFSQL